MKDGDCLSFSSSIRRHAPIQQIFIKPEPSPGLDTREALRTKLLGISPASRHTINYRYIKEMDMLSSPFLSHPTSTPNFARISIF